MLVKFDGHNQAQAWKIMDGNDYRGLMSYQTEVITIDKEGWLIVHALWRNTTKRHIRWFMKELGFTYQWARQLYDDNMMFNIFTGEVKEVA